VPEEAAGVFALGADEEVDAMMNTAVSLVVLVSFGMRLDVALHTSSLHV
jgi:hypothetical protein